MSIEDLVRRLGESLACTSAAEGVASDESLVIAKQVHDSLFQAAPKDGTATPNEASMLDYCREVIGKLSSNREQNGLVGYLFAETAARLAHVFLQSQPGERGDDRASESTCDKRGTGTTRLTRERASRQRVAKEKSWDVSSSVERVEDFLLPKLCFALSPSLINAVLQPLLEAPLQAFRARLVVLPSQLADEACASMLDILKTWRSNLGIDLHTFVIPNTEPSPSATSSSRTSGLAQGADEGVASPASLIEDSPPEAASRSNATKARVGLLQQGLPSASLFAPSFAPPLSTLGRPRGEQPSSSLTGHSWEDTRPSAGRDSAGATSVASSPLPRDSLGGAVRELRTSGPVPALCQRQQVCATLESEIAQAQRTLPRHMMKLRRVERGGATTQPEPLGQAHSCGSLATAGPRFTCSTPPRGSPRRCEPSGVVVSAGDMPAYASDVILAPSTPPPASRYSGQGVGRAKGAQESRHHLMVPPSPQR